MLRTALVGLWAVLIAAPVASQEKKGKKDNPPKKENKGAKKDQPKKDQPKKEQPKKEQPKQPARLPLQWDLSKPFFQKVSTKTTQAITVAGVEELQEQTHTFYYKWEPASSDDGKTKIKLTIEAIDIKINIAGNVIEFDSRNPNSTSALNTYFSGLANQSLTLVIDDKQKVVGVEGRKKMLDAAAGGADGDVRKMLESMLSEDALKQMADPIFGVVPAETKKKGDTWTSKRVLNLGPIGKYDVDTTYTHNGPVEGEKGQVKIGVSGKAKYAPPEKETKGLPFKVTSGDLSFNKVDGELTFDTAAGRLVKSESKVKLDGTLKVKVGEIEPKEVAVKQEQTVTVEVSDKTLSAEPAPKAPKTPKKDKKS